MKKKQLYSLPNNIWFAIKNVWITDKTLLFSTIGRIPIIVMIPLITTYLSKCVVELVSQNTSPYNLIVYIFAIIGIYFFLQFLDTLLGSKIEWRSFGNRFQYINLCSRKIMDTDYENIESPEGQLKMQKALNTVSSNRTGTQQIFLQIVNLFSNIIGLVSYTLLLLKLNVWIILLLLFLTIINYYLNKTYNLWIHINKDKWVSLDRKLRYIQYKYSDFSIAKDIRLFNMSTWLNSIYEKTLKERIMWRKKIEFRHFLVDVLGGITKFVRDGLAYGFLIYLISTKTIDISDFVFYFGLISQYSKWLFGLIDSYNILQNTSLGFDDLRDFLDMPDKFNKTNGEKFPLSAPEIIFDRVSYQYPNATNETLKEISFKISPNEKIALVGENGAGKTTLIKLLCGLYHPTKGRILINGIDLNNYNMNEYFAHISSVFQDIYIMPVTIAKNIAMCKRADINYEKIKNVLLLSDLNHKVSILPLKENTLLLKSVCENATDFSGGEIQKLALARAIYKDGKIMILDEPTAALDPIAENIAYQNYKKYTQNTTSIYVSHRLASTRFCDKILFLQDGKIVEEGTHEQLMQYDGNYAKMFNIQSHYYKQENCL